MVPNLSEGDVYHRGLRVNGLNKSICATILPTSGEVETYRAFFLDRVDGIVWLRYMHFMPGSVSLYYIY